MASVIVRIAQEITLSAARLSLTFSMKSFAYSSLDTSWLTNATLIYLMGYILFDSY